MESVRSRLGAAYRAAEYAVCLEGREIAIRVGESSGELEDLLGGVEPSSWAFVTACNPRSKPLSDEENGARHVELVARMRAMGREWFEGEGRDPSGRWGAERSLLVLGIELRDAVALGCEFGQNAILFGVRGGVVELVWCQEVGD